MHRDCQDEIGRSGQTTPRTRTEPPPEWSAVTERIIGCALEVRRALGTGLLERLYEEAFAFELSEAGLRVDRQRVVRVAYKSILLPDQRLDLVVNDLVIVEVKATDRTPDAHLAQLTSYLHAANLPLGLLINFHSPRLTDGVFRRVNGDAVARLAFPSSTVSSSATSASSAASAFDPRMT